MKLVTLRFREVPAAVSFLSIARTETMRRHELVFFLKAPKGSQISFGEDSPARIKEVSCSSRFSIMLCCWLSSCCLGSSDFKMDEFNEFIVPAIDHQDIRLIGDQFLA